MSVNLDLSFEIHDYDPSRREALLAATTEFLREEGLLDPFDMTVDCLGQTGYICGYTSFPAIISRSYVWVPDVTKRWKEMAERVNGGACRATLEVGYPDEE